LPLAVLLSSLLIPTLSTPAWAQICGNGLVEAGEACDPGGVPCPAGQVCTGCQCCGNGVLDPGEVCEPPGSACPGGQTCTDTCTCYSPADCTGPQVVGTDAEFDFVNGVRFPASSVFHTFLVADRAAGAPANLEFDLTAPGLSLFAFMSLEGGLRVFNPSGEDIYVAATRGGGISDQCGGTNPPSSCAAASVPIRSCPTSYGRFFDIDDDGDAQFDDMSVVFIDGDAMPLNFRMLFIPILWGGTQAQFDTAAQNQVNRFAANTALQSCLGTIEIVTLDVTTQNFATFPANCNVASITNFVRGLGLLPSSFDLTVGLVPNGASPCNLEGISNGADTVWVESLPTDNLAHEVGHIYALADEYCSQQSGGDPRCAGAGDFNFLGADLGCNPSTGGGCCTCGNPGAPMGAQACAAVCDPGTPPGNYHGCCLGNQGTAGGRCIMSTPSANSNFCQRCRNRLNGRTEIGCDALPSAAFRRVVAVDLDVGTDGEARLNAVEMADEGRGTRIDPPGNRFRIELTGPSGSLLAEEFDLIAYDAATPPDQFNVRYKAPVDFPMGAPPPLLLSLLDEGEVVFKGTLFGEPPEADAGGDIEGECTSPAGAMVMLDGSASSDPEDDMLSFLWSAPGISFDDANAEMPSAQFPLGDTTVTLVVSDGVLESDPDSATVSVLDSTGPSITLNGPADPTLECGVDSYTELGASASDVCDPTVTAATVGGDTADTGTPGVYIVTYDSMDAAGNPATQVTRSVTVADTTDPVIESAAAIPDVLWPPKHDMVAVEVSVSVSDACDAAPTCQIHLVGSNEPIDGRGDGNTSPDWQITGPLTVDLRAERSGSGNGRTYTIEVECTDASMNRAQSTVTVVVPHNQRP
jgi:hypothetical protein